jgi:hypothetical protein
MNKILFFDIDGTLLDAKGCVADSTREALRRAAQRGHKLFICTGRAKAQVFPEIMALGFDGVIAVTGAEVWVGDEMIFQSCMDPEQVERFLEHFEKKHCSYGLQTAVGALCTREGWEYTRQRFQRLGRDPEVVEANMRRFAAVDTLHGRQDVEKLFYNYSDETVEQVQAWLGDYFHVERSSFSDADDYSGEITQVGMDKSVGMARVLKYYGLDRKDSVAFGDGPNDAEMLSFAGTGVAMGNARPKLKALADYVTDDIFHDGILHAMEYLQLI